jgi:hypothetical protein
MGAGIHGSFSAFAGDRFHGEEERAIASVLDECLTFDQPRPRIHAMPSMHAAIFLSAERHVAW